VEGNSRAGNVEACNHKRKIDGRRPKRDINLRDLRGNSSAGGQLPERHEEARIDVLVMQDSNEWLGGYVKWFTDVSARNGYPMTVIFPVDEEMTTIMSGGRPPADKGPPAWTLRGTKNRLMAPYFPSIGCTICIGEWLRTQEQEGRHDRFFR
jgi:hypothetical protein